MFGTFIVSGSCNVSVCHYMFEYYILRLFFSKTVAGIFWHNSYQQPMIIPNLIKCINAARVNRSLKTSPQVWYYHKGVSQARLFEIIDICLCREAFLSIISTITILLITTPKVYLNTILLKYLFFNLTIIHNFFVCDEKYNKGDVPKLQAY